MSLAIITTTNEGNILAADSLETYKNVTGDIREGSENRMKLFQLNNRVGAVACGISFLENKNIQQHIITFKNSLSLEDKTVLYIADKLYDYFAEKYHKMMGTMIELKKKEIQNKGGKNIEININLECVEMKYKDGEGKEINTKFFQPILEILVAGHDPDGTNNVYKITIPDPKEKNGLLLKISGSQCGATWIGQTDVLVRIIRGWSPEIKRLTLIEQLPDKKKEELIRQINEQEYQINWATMTIQDAIDFSTLAIKTTESVQKITDGTWQNPGSSPGVGGPIDIAVTMPKKGYIWVQKKKISAHGNGSVGIDLDDFEDLP
jgi:hypothetical protein